MIVSLKNQMNEEFGRKFLLKLIFEEAHEK